MALFEFGDYSYQEITLKEKLLEVLSYLLRIGDFKQYAGKTILNNVYMDLRGKKPVFKRTKTANESINRVFYEICGSRFPVEDFKDYCKKERTFSEIREAVRLLFILMNALGYILVHT